MAREGVYYRRFENDTYMEVPKEAYPKEPLYEFDSRTSSYKEAPGETGERDGSGVDAGQACCVSTVESKPA